MWQMGRNISGGVSALHVVIVGLSLAMTLGAWLYSKDQVEKQIEARFAAAANSVVGLIADRMSRYEDALWSGVARIRSGQSELSHEEWKTFSASLRLEEKYPGVNGIGVIYYVDRSDLAEFQLKRGSEPRRFSIYPQHEFDFLLPITFIEPENINAAAVGLDVAHETNRREALLASRDTGRAQITGPIVLVQDSGHTPGFLFYTPFYEGSPPETLEERQQQFGGVVYAPFVVRNLVQGLLARDRRNVQFSIRDGTEIIYDEHSEDDAAYDPDPMFSETFGIDLYGRTWVVDIRTDLNFRAENGNEQPTLILLGGLVIEILVITLIMLLARANKKAHEYAHDLTAELRQKTQSLEDANKEIEQFVYVASHDLKTPTRGIGFLADLIEEDMDEKFGVLAEEGELKSHLGLIRERVERMNALTAGIMEYSRIGQRPLDQAPLSIPDIVKDCALDFGVRNDQISLLTDVDNVCVDSMTFRRVLENLIGNAFKYHQDRPRAHVDVRVTDLDAVLHVSVKDNGPGIDPKYHAKIFDVFQTLQVSDTPDSTGIGLAIVKKAVERHGGSIRVISELDAGTEFVFQWPKPVPEVDARLEDVA